MMKDGIPGTASIPQWCIENVPQGGTVGCDGLCTRFGAFNAMKAELEGMLVQLYRLIDEKSACTRHYNYCKLDKGYFIV